MCACVCVSVYLFLLVCVSLSLCMCVYVYVGDRYVQRVKEPPPSVFEYCGHEHITIFWAWWTGIYLPKEIEERGNLD